MLTIEDFGTIFLLTSVLGALAISSPALAFVFPSQAGERFSELYILGPNRMAEDYPFNVKAGENYKVYLGIGNHMGSSAYYTLYVKLRNQTEPLPNSTDGTPSPLPPVYEYRVLLSDGEVWEVPLNFSFRGLSFHGNSCVVETLSLNGLDLHVGKMVSWDSENKGYYLQLFFELWIYDSNAGGFSFDNRFVGIWLNATG
jgi:uncharacterized membrane protein